MIINKLLHQVGTSRHFHNGSYLGGTCTGVASSHVWHLIIFPSQNANHSHDIECLARLCVYCVPFKLLTSVQPGNVILNSKTPNFFFNSRDICQQEELLRTSHFITRDLRSSGVSRCVKSQKGADLICIAGEAWNHAEFITYTVCPTRYRTRHFFNNSKFEQEYVLCVRNEKEYVCSAPNCCDTEQRSASQPASQPVINLLAPEFGI